MASDVIDAADLKTSWEDVGGLDVTIQTLQEAVVLPLTRPELFPEGSSLMRVGSTVLPYHPHARAHTVSRCVQRFSMLHHAEHLLTDWSTTSLG